MEVRAGRKSFSIPMTVEMGIVFMVATTAVFAGSDSTAKSLGRAVPLLVLLLVRYFFQTVLLGVWQWHRGIEHFRNKGTWRLQWLRAFLLLANSASTFAGLRYLPLPESTSLAMMAPLISTLLAATLLGEKVAPRKWLLVVLGFIGMLMVVRPGTGQFTPAVIFPISAATTFAFFQVVSSKLSRTGDAITTNFYTALFATLVLLCLLFADQVTMLPAIASIKAGTWCLLLCMASLATFGQILMLQALKRAPLAVLTPFGYTQLAFATLLSWLVFGQVPTPFMAVGMVVIALSGAGTVLLHARSRNAAVRQP